MREESRIKERQKPEAELALEGRRRLGLLTFRPPSPEPGGLYLAEPVAAVYLRPPPPPPAFAISFFTFAVGEGSALLGWSRLSLPEECATLPL